MIKTCHLLAILLFSLVITTLAQPLNSIIVTPTFHNIGIDVLFDGTIPEDASIAVAVADLSSPQDFRKAHPLSRISDNRFAGSVFQVKANSAFIIRMSSTLFPADHYDTVTTRSEVFPLATGTVFHVASQGSDNNSGLSLTEAFASLGKAVSVAQAGNTILLHQGRYHEEITFPQSGTETDPIVIRSAPGEHAILDGRDTSFAPVWTEHTPLPGIYKTPYPAECHLAYHNGKHLFRYPDLNAMGTNNWGLPGAFYSDGTDLYVLFPHSGPPTDADTITVPAYTSAFTCEQDYIHLIDLEICYYGRNLYSRGLYLNNASYNLVDSCFFHHSNTGIGIKRASHFNTIQNCIFNDAPVETWSWQAIKEGTGYYESGAITVYSSDLINSGNVIRYNRISNKFDGAGTGSNNAPTTNMDFHDNVIEQIGDDAISCDGVGVNNRIYNNTMQHILVGVSVAPAAIGPHYIFRNLILAWRSNSGYNGYPIKLNVNSNLSTNWVYLYHNTCFTNVAGQDGFVFKQYSDWHNVISRNNIYGGTNYALISSASQNPVDFDYDNLYTSHESNFIRWEGNRYANLADFSTATSQEVHGISFYPDFVDTGKGNYYLKETSQIIDKGIIIPGINDSSNRAPDIGCFEYTGNISLDEPVNQKILPLSIYFQKNGVKGTIIKFSGLSALNPDTPIQFHICNLQGKLVYAQEIVSCQDPVIYHAQSMRPGMYIFYLYIKSKMMKYNRKVLLIQ